jgi:hypothetical protein
VFRKSYIVKSTPDNKPLIVPINCFDKPHSAEMQSQEKDSTRIGEPILFNENTYFLNKSKSKYVSTGLGVSNGFKPVIKIAGGKNQCVTFDLLEWRQFLTNQGVVTNWFYATDDRWSPITVSNLSIEFVWIVDRKVIKITQKKGSEIYLALETISGLWELLPIIKYRIDFLITQNFHAYYDNFVNRIAKTTDENLFSAMEKIIDSNPPNENIVSMLEIIRIDPGAIKADIDTIKQHY